MKFAAWYAILVGLLMVGQWIFSLTSGQVPELQSEPWRIAFHLLAEGATALSLILGGTALLRRTTWAQPVYLVATGMLLYSLIVSPGYFAQLGEWPLVGMFAALLVLALVSLAIVMRAEHL